MFIKKILLLFTLLFIFSCVNSVTTPSDGAGSGNIDSNLTFLEHVDNELVVDSDGRYISKHNNGGKTYFPYVGLTYIFVKEISRTKGIYSQAYRPYIYGHEIRSGVLYATDDIATDIDSIKWEKAKKVGVLVTDYSGVFLSNVKGKKLDSCENYFDPQTGRIYLEKYSNVEEKFSFVQALSVTKAIYENNQNGVSKFMGLSTVGEDLYETAEADDISSIKWSSTKVGKLYLSQR